MEPEWGGRNLVWRKSSEKNMLPRAHQLFPWQILGSSPGYDILSEGRLDTFLHAQTISLGSCNQLLCFPASILSHSMAVELAPLIICTLRWDIFFSWKSEQGCEGGVSQSQVLVPLVVQCRRNCFTGHPTQGCWELLALPRPLCHSRN